MAVLAGAIMAEAQQELKILHPFFVKRSKSKEDLAKNPHDTLLATASAGTDGLLPSSAAAAMSQVAGSTKPGRGRPRKTPPETDGREARAELLEVDPNLERRKRQKSTSVEDKSRVSEAETSCRGKQTAGQDNTAPRQWENGGSEPASGPLVVENTAELPREPLPEAAASTSSGEDGSGTEVRILGSRPTRLPRAANSQVIGVYLPQNLPSELETPDPPQQPPRKLLQLNSKTGTIGSPPKSKSKVAEASKDKIRKPRGRKLAKSLVVTVIYGYDVEARTRIGRKIDQLMERPFPPPATATKNLTKVSPISRPVSAHGPLKSTHPFFLGKAAPKSDIVPVPAVTNADVPIDAPKPSPSKARKMFTTPRPYSPVKHAKDNMGGFGHAFGNATKIMRFPGAIEPCWPPRQMMHVRGYVADGDTYMTNPVASDFIRTGRKSKHAVIQIPTSEEIIRKMIPGLHVAEVVEELSQTRSDEFAKPVKCLRIPGKHFESGKQLQKHVRTQIASPLPLPFDPQSREDEIGFGAVRDTKTHPALEKIYHALPTSLTAFDRSTYETQSWTNKYAPKNAAEVLQSGKEAFILKDWLLALAVTTVDKGAIDNRSRAGSVASKHSVGKRKRKSNKLEGFVISSGEEDNDMDEISEPEDDPSSRGSQGLLKRTVIRAGDVTRRESGKIPNAVVISGPSGCGKTATVYAVAKELGFEVFEINSGGRRSGKDVLEKVGDMTRNHQVQRSKQRPSDLPDDDIAHVTETLAEDLRSGRQGTMNSFFKPQGTKSKASKAEIKKEQTPVKPLPKHQKQSLILLEEVDILFEEDKQFWATIMALIAQSKRPIIMTCNDESLVPLQSLVLHAILRLTPPPMDIAVDYMLLVAAAEGHIIQRQAAKTLFEARGLDLRASLTDLDYWCQIGVGDCKGGLDWFYPRWPPGSDVDAQGNTIRVVSEGTYETGMGWLSRDSLIGHVDKTHLQQQLLHEVWDGWQIDHPFESAEPRSVTLASYEDLTESLSVADMSGSKRLAQGNQTLLDTTPPPLPVKSREDFILGRELLEADLFNDFDSTAKSVAFCIQTLANIDLNRAATSTEFDGLSTTASLIIDAIAKMGLGNDDSISGPDFSIAFDPIAEPERKTWGTASLEPSVFDRTTSVIAADVAPYVRSIVCYDARLQQDRARLSNLLSEGGRKGKRMRTTRAALSALEGGARNTTRAERYFGPTLNPVLVLKTGLQSWQDAVDSDLAGTIGMQEVEEIRAENDSDSPGE